LRLRAWRDDDAAQLDRLRADERYMRYLGTADDGASQVARFRAHWDERGYGLWAVEDRATGRFAGRVGLSHHRLWPQDVEVGWAFDPELWGRGYATEASAAAIAHAFETLRLARVISILHPQNTASIRVAEKLGERPHATVWWPEDGIDLLVYALEGDQWNSASAS
jgi:RimJ/RimL family protein N-acetyltransferase